MERGVNKVRFGVVGTNFITDRIIAAGRLDLRFEVAGVCSRTAERAAEYAARHDIPHTFTSLEQMASSGLIDAVYIASPNAFHARQAICCLECGKHVLCEKPLASNAREAREMIAAAHKSGRLLMEAMKPTLGPNFRVVKEYLPRTGVPRRFFAAFGKYSSRYDALKVHYSRGEGVLPNAFNPELSNGAAMDMGVYSIYPMVALWGRPAGVQATAVMFPSGVDGHGAVNFSYGGAAACADDAGSVVGAGMISTTLYSKMADMSLPWEIEGEDGTIRGDAIDAIRKVEFRERGGGWQDISAVSQVVAHDTPEAEYFYEIAHFIDLIESGFRESDINTHECSLAVMEILDEIRRQTGVVYPADK